MTAMIRDNAHLQRFELEVEGHVAFADYRRDGGVVYLPHVEAPPALRGKGVASRLMAGVMEKVRAEGLKVVPQCGYARTWLRRHPEHRDLIAS